MTYPDAIQFLYSLRWFGAKFGLENTLKLAALAGNPQDQLRFIHVAGTNGKGSTCAMLESIYRAAGLRVGLFTSPHLVSFRERIQIDRELIGEADVVRLVEEMQKPLKEFPPDHHPTFFEVVTVMALRYFAELRCDLVIWETGLGGRLDATNIVTPLASVITNVQLDHQQWLGDTLAQIAREKAGVIKPGVPIITATDEPEALGIIEQIARENNAPLAKVERSSRVVETGEASGLPLLGGHQRLNAALALRTIEVVQSNICVTAEQIRTGLSRVEWPGRLQLVTLPNGQKILLDGAHNIASAETLRTALTEYFPQSKPTLVLGILRDKDWQPMCKVLALTATRILTTPVSSDRTVAPSELAQVCRAINPSAQTETCSSLAEALRNAANDAFTVITGSLYLVGEALELLGISSNNASDERRLNEWSTGRQNLNSPPVARR